MNQHVTQASTVRMVSAALILEVVVIGIKNVAAAIAILLQKNVSSVNLILSVRNAKCVRVAVDSVFLCRAPHICTAIITRASQIARKLYHCVTSLIQELTKDAIIQSIVTNVLIRVDLVTGN